MAEEELAHAASHDPLTGLANRALLNRRLVKALHTGNTEGRHHQVAVLYVDLNGFTSINDTFGHSAGDEVLLTVAHRLTSVAGPGCTVGRLGRDEFAVVAPRCSAAAMAALKLRIERSLIEMHCVHGQLVAVGGSVGAHLAAAGDDADEVLRLADNRRYRVKKEQQIP